MQFTIENTICLQYGNQVKVTPVTCMHITIVLFVYVMLKAKVHVTVYLHGKLRKQVECCYCYLGIALTRWFHFSFSELLYLDDGIHNFVINSFVVISGTIQSFCRAHFCVNINLSISRVEN